MTEDSRSLQSRLRSAPFLRSVRTRIIASYLILLTLGTLVSVLVVRQILIVRLEDRIESQLTQEVQEFRRLASEGIDPTTGEPFGRDVDRLFSVFLARNVPAEGEELIAIPRRGAPRYRYSERAQRAVEQGGFDPSLIDRWRTLEGVDSGELDTTAGPVNYLAVPVERGGETLGSFVVVNFSEEEREEVEDSVWILALVSGGVLIVGTLLAFFAAGRVLAPLRELRDAARSITASDLTRRIDVEGDDEIARARPHLQRDARPPGGRVRAVSGSSSATPGTSCGRRSRSSAGTSSCSRASPETTLRPPGSSPRSSIG